MTAAAVVAVLNNRGLASRITVSSPSPFKPEQCPPVAGRMQHAHDGHAIRTRLVEDQVIVSVLHPPLPEVDQCRTRQIERRPHLRLQRQIRKAGFGAVQEAFSHDQPGLFGQLNEVLDQVAPRRLALTDDRHQRDCRRASTFARASVRIARQSAAVSSVSALFSPSISLASSCSSAL